MDTGLQQGRTQVFSKVQGTGCTFCQQGTRYRMYLLSSGVLASSGEVIGCRRLERSSDFLEDVRSSGFLEDVRSSDFSEDVRSSDFPEDVRSSDFPEDV
ncbi:hypothetical protein L6452_02600 [Arctium lappa]|uniref:Uncharacterized protein n=1 Tax=Arctium lappa TaxID=4217 RepID=A0ACB9FKS0_ARCLA|nr:hypothetical protein L6452_02600 [Arctium lappa]